MMKFDPDIIQTVLFSVARRKPLLLAHQKKAKINRNKRLLLKHGFTCGACSIDSLTTKGQSLLDLSANEAAWKRAKDAYADSGYSWSLLEFHAFLKDQACREKRTPLS